MHNKDDLKNFLYKYCFSITKLKMAELQITLVSQHVHIWLTRSFCGNLKKQAMMTLQGMADHRFTSVSLSTNVFLGEIIFSP